MSNTKAFSENYENLTKEVKEKGAKVQGLTQEKSQLQVEIK